MLAKKKIEIKNNKSKCSHFTFLVVASLWKGFLKLGHEASL